MKVVKIIKNILQHKMPLKKTLVNFEEEDYIIDLNFPYNIFIIEILKY